MISTFSWQDYEKSVQRNCTSVVVPERPTIDKRNGEGTFVERANDCRSCKGLFSSTNKQAGGLKNFRIPLFLIRERTCSCRVQFGKFCEPF